MTNSIELLQRATLCLTQDGAIKDRLVDAYAGHLAEVDAEQLPDSLRGDFKALCAAMQRETPLARESAVRASVRKMSLPEVRGHAALVVRLFAAMARTEPVPPRAPRVTAPLLQLFSTAEA